MSTASSTNTDDAAMTVANASAEIYSCPNKAAVGDELCRQIVTICQQAIQQRGVFTVAMSGGSLPAFLSKLPQTFKVQGIDPQYSKWHVLLADERGVPETHKDSNLLALQKSFLTLPGVSIPAKNIYGINKMSLCESMPAVAIDYQTKLLSVLPKSGGQLDLALLGMGEDGHTCSLFPNHPLLQERQLYVAPIVDSPKPPPNRITLTFRALEQTRQVIFCATGEAKSPILAQIIQEAHRHQQQKTNDDDNDTATGSPLITAQVCAVYPCGMVRPQDRLVYIVDDDAMKQVPVTTDQ